MSRSRILAASLLTLTLGACSPDAIERAITPTTAVAPAAPAGDVAKVVSITDGDTLRVRLTTAPTNAATVPVRLIGIDTPETRHPTKGVECYGREASAFLGQLVPPGTEVRLVYDVERTDRYQRTLAYLYRVSDGLFVNLELARQGYASQATFPPNVAHVEDFRRAVAEAKRDARGLWSVCP